MLRLSEKGPTSVSETLHTVLFMCNTVAHPKLYQAKNGAGADADQTLFMLYLEMPM